MAKVNGTERLSCGTVYRQTKEAFLRPGSVGYLHALDVCGAARSLVRLSMEF